MPRYDPIVIDAKYRKEVRDRFNKNHPNRTAEYHRKRKFGLTSEQFDKMVEDQNNKCAICGNTEPGKRNGKIKALAVDHNRITGKIRKLLCSRCNTAIGLLNEDIQLFKIAIEYIKAHN